MPKEYTDKKPAMKKHWASLTIRDKVRITVRYHIYLQTMAEQTVVIQDDGKE